jgi:hypothetical protein
LPVPRARAVSASPASRRHLLALCTIVQKKSGRKNPAEKIGLEKKSGSRRIAPPDPLAGREKGGKPRLARLIVRDFQALANGFSSEKRAPVDERHSLSQRSI